MAPTPEHFRAQHVMAHLFRCPHTATPMRLAGLIALAACAEPVLTLSTRTPDTTDALVATYSGPHQDRVTLHWHRPDLVVDAPTLRPAVTSRGDIWTAEARHKGEVLISERVEILNAPPTLGRVVFKPDPPMPGDHLIATIDHADVDEDPVTLTWSWTVNDVPVSTSPEVDLPVTAETIVLTVTADDGEAQVTTQHTRAVDRSGIGGNLLLLIADDLGVDKIGAYGVHPDAPETPAMDRLMEESAWFLRAYGSPVCSPSRTALLTGRQTHRYHVGAALSADDTWGLPLEEVTIPEALAATTEGLYSSVALGKWHVAPQPFFSEEHPILQGFDAFAGSLGNLNTTLEDGSIETYHRWNKWEDGTWSETTTYATTDTVDDTLAAFDTLPEPWFLHVGFNAPHAPFDPPPDHLNPSGVTDLDDRTTRYHAVVEALDMELDRLLAGLEARGLDRRTHVVFLSDNGTPKGGAIPPFESKRVKSSPYEGGIRVPLMIRGPLVRQPGVPRAQLVHLMDLFPTLLAFAGVPTEAVLPHLPDPTLDAVNILPVLLDPEAPPPRDTMVSLGFKPAGPQWTEAAEQLHLAVRDPRYKLVRPLHGEDELYDLGEANLEGLPLPLDALTEEQAAALSTLRTRIAHLPQPTPL